jgi:hypothetical protein
MSDLCSWEVPPASPATGWLGCGTRTGTYGRNVLPVAVGTFSSTVGGESNGRGTTARSGCGGGRVRFRISPKANGSTAMVYNGSQPLRFRGHIFGAVWVKAVRKNIAVALSTSPL